MQNQNELNACPQCGGGPFTWKCTCEPMWLPTAVVLDDERAVPHPLSAQVKSAQAEMKTWSDERRANVRLEGNADPQPVAQPVAQPVEHSDEWRAGYVAGCNDSESKFNFAQGVEPVISENLHPDTAKLVRRFARALGNKLLSAQIKYGYSNNWQRDDWANECRAELMRHIAKGDPRDVAAYCAFLWHHDWPTAAAQPVEQTEQVVAAIEMAYWNDNRAQILDAITKAGYRLESNRDGFWLHPVVPPVEQTRVLTKEQLIAIEWAIETSESVALGHYDGTHLTWEYEQALRALLIAASPQPVAQPVEQTRALTTLDRCYAPSCGMWDGTDTCTCQRQRQIDTLKGVATALPVLKTMLHKEGLSGADIADELLADVQTLLTAARPASGETAC